MTKSEKSREWLLDGLPARNRFAMKHLARTAPSWVAKRNWLIKIWCLRYKLYQQAPKPNEEAVHTRWDIPFRMKTPRTQIQELHDQAKGPGVHSDAVAWGKAMLDQTDGRMISLLPGVGPNGIG